MKLLKPKQLWLVLMLFIAGFSAQGQLYDFEASTQEELAGETIHFNAYIDGGSNFVWDFEADQVTDSLGEFTSHAYVSPGLYTVVLYYDDANGNPQTLVKDNYITIHSQTDVTAWASRTKIMTGESAEFYANVPNALSVQLDFNGDGILDTVGNANTYFFHTYIYPGIYDLSMVYTYDSVTFDTITRYGYMDVFEAEPDFITHANSGPAPLMTNFESTLLPHKNVRWDFDGDMVADTAGTSLYWSFNTPGVYDVTMFWDEGTVIKQLTKNGYIQVVDTANGKAEFWADITQGNVPLYINLQTNVVADTIWWDFNNDGIADTLGSNLYLEIYDPGTYSVTMIWDSAGTQKNIYKQDYIQVFGNPMSGPQFWAEKPNGFTPHTAMFYTNLPDIANVQWDFTNDSIPEVEGNQAEWTFTEPGTYNVTVLWKDAEGNQMIHTIWDMVTVDEPPFIPQFWANTPTGLPGLTTTFGTNLPDPSTLEWDFDQDGNIDGYGPDVSWTYYEIGAYNADVYWIDNMQNSHMWTVNRIVEIFDILPDAQFWADQPFGSAPYFTTLRTDLPPGTNVEWDIDMDGSVEFTGTYFIWNFNEPRNYNVAVSWIDSLGNPQYREIYDIVKASGGVSEIYFWTDIQQGAAPFNTTFYSSLPVTEWVGWDFDGDNQIDAEGNTVNWQFVTPGIYSVTMFWEAGTVQESIKKMDFIHVFDQGAVEFWADKTYGESPFYTVFHSTLPDTMWVAWDVDGDGLYDIEGEGADYTYYYNGLYTVTMFWYENDVEQQLTKYDMIDVYGGGSQEASCATATPAYIGQNYFDGSNYQQAYTFTPQEEGKMYISTCNDFTYAYIKVFKGCNWDWAPYQEDYCYSDDNGESNGMNVMVDVIPGQEYLIIIEGDINSYFEWTLNMHIPQQGENCDNPLFIGEGTHLVNHWGIAETVYYQYVAKQDGIVTVASCEESGDDNWVEISTGDPCNGSFVTYGDDECGNQPNAKFSVKTGQVYNIAWGSNNRNAIHSWHLLFEQGQLPAGTSCDNAIEAVLGENQLIPNTILIWYEYLVQKEGIVRLSANPQDMATLQNIELEIFSNCNIGDNSPSRINYADTSAWTWAYPGEVLKIVWIIEDLPDVASKIPFYISEEPQIVPSGVMCETPLVAQEGINTTTGISQVSWFTFTAPEDGILTVSNCNTQMEYYEANFFYNCTDPIYDTKEDYCTDGRMKTSAIIMGGTNISIAIRQDRLRKFEWELFFSPATDANLYAFASPAFTSLATIDHNLGEIKVELGAYTDPMEVYANIEVANGAQIYINDMEYYKDQGSSIDLSDTAYMTIIALNDIDATEWMIIPSKASAPQTGNDIYWFNFGENQAAITDTFVHLLVPYKTDMCGDIYFELSPLARLEREYGNGLWAGNWECFNEGSNTLIATSESGETKLWNLFVEHMAPVAGETCDYPITVSALHYEGYAQYQEWYSVKIPETGFYKVDINIGAMLQYNICNFENEYDYIGGHDNNVYYFEAGQTIGLQTYQEGNFILDIYPSAPSSDTEIRSVEFFNTKPNYVDIDHVNGEINVEFPYSAGLGIEEIFLECAKGATMAVDTFEGNYLYPKLDLSIQQNITVIAQDNTVKTYVLNVFNALPRTGANIKAFDLASLVIPAVISETDQKIYALVHAGSLTNQLLPFFQLSPGASAFVGAAQIFSGNSPFMYSAPVDITVVAEDGTQKTWTLVVEEDNPTIVVPVESVSLSVKNKTVEVNASFSLSATVLPLNATNRKVHFKSESTSLAVVDTTGFVKTLAVGNVAIVATSDDGGFTDTLHLQIIKPQVKEIFAEPYYITIVQGDSLMAPIHYLPITADPPSLVFESFDPNIASADGGKIKALAKGVTQIWVGIANNANIATEFMVEVITEEIPVDTIYLDKYKFFLPIGGMAYLTPYIEPTNATYPQLIFTSGDESKAIVDQQGVVKAVGAIGDTVMIKIASAKYPEVSCEAMIFIDRANDVPITNILLPESITVVKGQSIAMPVIIEPTNATNKKLQWISFDESIAMIYENGFIEGIEEGTTDVFAVATDGSGISSTYAKVIVETVGVTEIKSTIGNQFVMTEGDVVSDIFINVLPENASNKNLLWSSNDPNIVNVTSTGIITATSVGSTKIIVKSEDNPTAFAEILVVVLAKETFKDELFLAIEEAKARIAYAVDLGLIGTAAGQYPQASVDKLSAHIDTANIVFADQNAMQEIIDSRTLTLWLAIEEFDLSINNMVLVDSINIARDELKIPITSLPVALNVQVMPETASIKTLLWKSLNTSVASVTKGVISPKGAGSTVVYAYATDGSEVYDSIRVTVTVPVKELQLASNSYGVEVGLSISLNAIVLPEEATNKTLVWKVENEDVASITQMGVLTGKTAGYTNVVVSTADGLKTAFALVAVMDKAVAVDSMYMPDILQMIIGGEKIAKPEILPFNATNKNMIWTSSSSSIISVAESGLIKALTPGKAKVYGTTEDGNFQDSTLVIVKPSLPPVATPYNIVVKSAIDTIIIKLANYIVDDNTDAQNLKITVASTAFSVKDTLGRLIFAKKDAAYVGSENLIATVTDKDGLSVSWEISITVSEAENTAPVISNLPSIYAKKGRAIPTIDLTGFVTDDYTAEEDIVWNAISTNNIYARIIDGIAEFFSISNNFLGIDTVKIVATDKDNASDTAIVSIEITDKEDAAPVVTEVPEQIHNNETDFKPINLASYVSDDFTNFEDLIFEVNSSLKVNVIIENGVATAEITDPMWTGSEAVIVTITDSEGNQSEITLIFNQEATVDETWEAAPAVSFYAEKTIVGIGKQVSFHASISGNATQGYEWRFPDGDPSIIEELNPKVTYSKPGRYSATFMAQNKYGTGMETKEDYISVVGITTPDTIVAKGTTLTLAVSDANLTSYEWSNGSSGFTADIVVMGDTTVTLLAKYGLFKYYDTVNIQIERPHKEELSVATFSETSTGIILAWMRTPGVHTAKYEVLRETSVNDEYEVIATKAFGDDSYFIDQDANSLKQAYRYKLRTYDSISGLSVESEFHRTLHLQTSYSASNGSVNLEWSKYEGVDVPTYFIYRISADGTVTKIDEVSSNVNAYNDLDPEYGSSYRIAFDLPSQVDPTKYGEALKSDSGPYSQSLSNLAESGVEVGMKNVVNVDVKAYPIPATNELSITVNAPVVCNVTIVDMKGAVIKDVGKVSSNKTIKVDVENFANQAYKVVVNYKNGSKTIMVSKD